MKTLYSGDRISLVVNDKSGDIFVRHRRYPRRRFSIYTKPMKSSKAIKRCRLFEEGSNGGTIIAKMSPSDYCAVTMAAVFLKGGVSTCVKTS